MFEKYGITPESAGLIGTGAVMGGLAVRSYMRSFLNDRGHQVYLTPDFEALQAVVSVCEDNGLEPNREISDEKVVQALMGDNRTVFLVSRPDVWDEMGRPSAAPMLHVKNPVLAAEKAITLFREKGYIGETMIPIAPSAVNAP